MTVESITEKLANLERQVAALRDESTIFKKAWRVLGPFQNYAEFGAFRGESLTNAYWMGKSVVDELSSGVWDHAMTDPENAKRHFQEIWSKVRFFAFDSFEGMPANSDIDAKMPIFPEGTYRCSEDDFWATLRQWGVRASQVTTRRGFFEESLTDEWAAKNGFGGISIVHIDSDLYESARLALNFVERYLCDRAVIIFDEWYQFQGDPDLGEQRAFREWCERFRDKWKVAEFHKEGAFRNSFLVVRR